MDEGRSDKTPGRRCVCFVFDCFLMQGLLLPAGTHEIEMRFDPPVKGLYVSLLALLIGLALSGILIFTRRSSPQPDLVKSPPKPELQKKYPLSELAVFGAACEPVST